jgi:hypothetical protein
MVGSVGGELWHERLAYCFSSCRAYVGQAGVVLYLSQKVIISVRIMVEFEGRLLLIINEVRSDLLNKRLPFQKSNRFSGTDWNWQMSISSITDYSCIVGVKTVHRVA